MGLRFMVSLAGPLAMIGSEPRQARKGATVTADSCAVDRLAGDTSNFLTICSFWHDEKYRLKPLAAADSPPQ